MEIGSYIKYKNSVYLAVKRGDSFLSLLNPETGIKLRVHPKNCELVNIPSLNILNYKNGKYLVTRYGHIISLTTCRVMRWGDENGDRKALLELNRNYLCAK